jgi:hypothetical protein
MKYAVLIALFITSGCGNAIHRKEESKITSIKSPSELLKDSSFFQAVTVRRFGIGAQSALGLINGQGEIIWVWHDNIVIENSKVNEISISLTTAHGPSGGIKILPNSELSSYLFKALKCAKEVNSRNIEYESKYGPNYHDTISNSLDSISVILR